MLNRILVVLVLLVLLAVGTSAVADETIESLDWLAGHWVVEAFGGVGEEVWLPAAGNAMHGMFRLTVDGKMNFSEFIQVTENDGQIVMRFKHFNPDYTTWETGDELMELAATEITPDKVVFEAIDESRASRIVYALVDDELHVTVAGVDEVLRFRRK